MGFCGLTLTGLAFICIGIWQTFKTIKVYLTKSSQSSPLYKKDSIYLAELGFVASLAIIFIINGVLTSFKDLQNGDHLGLAIELEISGVASIFLLYSVVGIISEKTHFLPLPWEVLDVIALFAFAEEFLVFYLQKDGSAGLENRYFSLLLVPISVCMISKALEIPYPNSVLPPLGLSAGLILQGTWFIQMAISFFTRWLSHGCQMSETSGRDYTIHCKSHADGHRAKAIATLQFNCHMALMLVFLLPVYSYLSTKYDNFGVMKYKPLGEHPEELQELDGSGAESGTRFALDSDEDEVHEATLHDHGSISEVNGVHSV